LNPAIDYYENVTRCSILTALDFHGGAGYTYFEAPDHLHSFMDAQGLPEQRFACFCLSKVNAEFRMPPVPDTPERRARCLLKLTACWRQWRKYTHPVTLSLNGRALYDEELFLQNVCRGWPSLYFPIPAGWLKAGANALEIVNRDQEANTLILERVEILRRPDANDMTVRACPEFAVAGEPFTVRLSLLKSHKRIDIACPKRVLEYLGRKGDSFRFLPKRAAGKLAIRFVDSRTRCTAVVNEVYPSNPDRVFVGYDHDDTRHDETGQMEQLLDHFADTHMGNFIKFAPKPNRNCSKTGQASAATWKRWFAFCRDRGLSFQFAGRSDVVRKEEIARWGGAAFDGFHEEEPYTIFQTSVHRAPPSVVRAKDMLEKKRVYVGMLEEPIAQNGRLGAGTSFFDAALLCVYLGDTGVQAIHCEVLSNSALHYGAARGTGKTFGADAPLDWYIGFPHDEWALKRFRLLLALNYAYGGTYLYCQSGAFETNAHDRHDWESSFCRGARQVLRDVYRFTRKESRTAAPDVPLALVYGHLESMFWLPDDRIPEMAETGDWDRPAWGKWQDTRCRWVWKASEAWLPRLPLDDIQRHESLTNQFSGTPYGQVNVVQPVASLGAYQVVAFMGWNTMTDEIYENLLAYVRDGGALFIAGCHFDTRMKPTGKPRMLRRGKVAELIGAEIAGPGETLLGDIRRCALKNVTARRMGEHFLLNRIGKGKVYFGDFYDYPHDMRMVGEIKKLLERLGRDVRDRSPYRILGRNARYFNANLWSDGGTSRLYLVNIDWTNHRPKRIEVVIDGQRKRLNVPGGRLVVVQSGPRGLRVVGKL